MSGSFAAIIAGNDVFSYGASYKSSTQLAANTAEAVFSPGSNVNGAIVWSAQCYSRSTVTPQSGGFVAKTSAPANILDGDVILAAGLTTFESGTPTWYVGGQLVRPLRIAAGKGLYAIWAIVESYAYRQVLYTLL